MREQLKEEFGRIFASLALQDASSFSFGGRTHHVGTAPLTITGPDALVALLQFALYQHAYTNRFSGTLVDVPQAVVFANDLTSTLSQANPARDRWETGWTVLQVLASGEVAAQRFGVTRLLWPGEFLTADSNGAPRAGTRIHLLWKREAPALQPGFYFAFGETVSDHQDEGRYVRLYWHVRPAGAAALLSAVSKALNRFSIPFRLKLLNHSSAYGRSDAAVLYIARRHFRVVSELLAEIHPEVRQQLDTDTPLFTKRLAPGLGFAEDPGTGESFGMSRCRLLAEAMVEAFRRGEQTADLRWNAVEQRFRDVGLSLDTPYLNPGAIDDYVWPTN